MNRYLWDVLLYACMGCFSYFFLVHYADIPVRLQDRLMTFHTFLAVIVSFCGVGLSMRYINERLLTYYPYFLRNKRMLSAGLIAAAVILLLSNYLLLVPPLSLQLLVENVIKHNVISMKKPMTVKMWTEPQGDDVWICVANAVRPKQGGVTSGKGLENLS